MPIEALITGVGLGMDAMSVAAAVGVKWNGPHQKFRLAWHMGLSQFLMPCIGYLFGQPLASQLNSYGKYVAAALVAGLGIKMLVEAVESNPGKSSEKIEAGGERVMAYVRRDPTRGMSLIILSLATSLDALVVGFSLSLRAASAFNFPHLLYDATIIGLVASLMALIGVNIGQRLGTSFGRIAEIGGAIILIVVAGSFLVTWQA